MRKYSILVIITALLIALTLIVIVPDRARAAGAPQVVSITPADGTTFKDSWGGVIRITYDQPVQLTDQYLRVYVNYYDGTTKDEVRWMGNVDDEECSVSADGLTVTIHATSGYLNNEFHGNFTNGYYWLGVDPGAVVSRDDPSVNAEYWGDHNWKVHVIDAPPEIVSTYPAFGAAGIPYESDTTFSMTFDEHVATQGTAPLYIYKWVNGGSWNDAYKISCIPSFDGNMINFTLSESLDPSTRYGIMVPGPGNSNGLSYNLIKDYEYYSNIFPGIDCPVEGGSLPYGGCWYFTTASDTPSGPPELVSTNPATGQFNFEPGGTVTMTFNKIVRASTGNVYIKKYSDNSIVQTIPASVILPGAMGTKAPHFDAAGLDKNTKYYINIDPDAFLDEWLEEPYAGLSGNSLYFTTTRTYTLAYNAWGGGAITGSTTQTVDEGHSGTTVTAVPNEHCHFTQWGDNVMTAARTDTNVTHDINVFALFALDTYSVNYAAGTGGSISGNASQTVSYGYNGTQVTAVPDTANHYHFVRWSDGKTNATRAETNVTGNISVTAQFALDTRTLTYSTDGNGSITGTNPQTVDYGGSGTAVTAVPGAHYHFLRWSDGVLTAARTDTNVTDNINVTAQFALDTYSVNYAAGTGGSITGNASQTVSYGGSGTAVTAVADTANHYHFVQWSDGVLTASRTDTGVTGDINVTARFALDTRTLTYSTDGHGSISGANPQTVDYGGSGTAVTAVPGEHYHFVKWSDNYANATRTDTGVTDDINVTAEFALDIFTLQYLSGGNGVITGNAAQTVAYGGSGTQVTAAPAPGYHFVQWSDGILTAGRTDTGVTGNITVTAAFGINIYTLTYTAGQHGSLTGDLDQSVEYGDSGTQVIAVPDENYHFVKWSDGVTASYRTDTNVAENKNLTAEFAINKFKVTFKDYDGTVLKTQYVAYGSDAAPPDDPEREGYKFTGWDGDYYDVTSAETVTAEYVLKTYKVTFADYDGKELKTQSVGYGLSASPPADPVREGYTFTGWSGDYTKITGIVTFTAQYKTNTFKVTFVDFDGRVIDTQDVEGGSGAAAPADPVREGYLFTGWDKDFTGVTADITITAQYKAELVVTNEETQDGSPVVVVDTGDLDITEVTLEGGEASVNPDGTLKLEFPNDVKAGDYKLKFKLADGTELTENITITDEDIAAMSNAGRSGTPVWLWITAGALVIAAAVLITIFVRRLRHSK